MRPKFSVYIATSLDGYIARRNGDISWLHTEEPQTEANEDYGYEEFTSHIDCMIMGRGTFDVVKSFEPWPYQNKRVLVLSNSLPSAPIGFEGKIELATDTPIKIAERLYEGGIRHVYLDGGKVIQSFLREGLVDDMIITRLPVLIGQGIPLFGDLSGDLKLSHDWTKSYSSGFVQSRYTLPD